MKNRERYYRRYAQKKMDKKIKGLLKSVEEGNIESDIHIQQMNMNGSSNLNRSQLPINPITKDMFWLEMPYLFSIPVSEGFVLVEEYNYKTSIHFETSNLALYEASSDMEQIGQYNQQYRYLSGYISYNISIGPFRPFEPELSRNLKGMTTFAVSGTLPVNKILPNSDIGGNLSYSYQLTYKEENPFITSFEGISYHRYNKRPYFYNLLNNPNFEREVSVPIILRIE